MTVTADRMAFVLELMALFGITIVILAICGAAIAIAALQKTEHLANRALPLLIHRAGFLQILTVVVIVETVFVLRLFDGISSESTISVLSGIAGYVLGGITSPQAPQVSAQTESV